MEAVMSYPPGPTGLPILGSALDAMRDPLQTFTDATVAHGDIVGFRMLHLKYVLVTNPEAIRHVLVENHKNYVKSRNYEGLRVILGQGLVTSEGETWRKQRRLAQPGFHHKRIASFVATMAECTRDMLGRWQAEHAGGVVDVHKEMMRLTFRIVGRALLSRDLDGDASAIGEALNIGLHWANDYADSLFPIPSIHPHPRGTSQLRRAMKTFDGLIQRAIEERRAEGHRDDLLSMLLESVDEETGEAMSDKLLRDELITMVSAGPETTANALSFALYLLSVHPEWMRAGPRRGARRFRLGRARRRRREAPRDHVDGHRGGDAHLSAGLGLRAPCARARPPRRIRCSRRRDGRHLAVHASSVTRRMGQPGGL